VEVQLEAVGERLLDLVLAQLRLGAFAAGHEFAADGQQLDRLARTCSAHPTRRAVARVADRVAGSKRP
jgi:hypothetical protein